MQINNLIGELFKNVILLLLIFTPLVSNAQRLYMVSQPGDYIGQGTSWDFTDATHTFTASQNYDQGVTVRVDGPNWWTLNFAAPGEIPLTPGLYEGAIRFPFQPITLPGLSVSGDGRGCNELSGEFTVHEVVYNPDGSIALFAADFEQHCEHFNPGLYGAIRFNSDYPVDVFIPDAAARAGADQHAMDGQQVSLDGTASFTNDGSVITSYYWSQIGGPGVVLDDPTSPTPSFYVPVVPLGGAELDFELEVMTSSGAFDTDTVKVRLASKSDAQTFIMLSSEAGDYLGQGQDYFLTPIEGPISVSSADVERLEVKFDGADSWTFRFASTLGTPLQPGIYLNAVYEVYRDETTPGMYIFGPGRSCFSNSIANYEVLEYDRETTGTVNSLAIDFDHRCNATAPLLTGSIRYNYVDPSVPTADAGTDQAIAGGDAVTLDGSGSNDSDGMVASFAWTQLGGTAVTLLGPDTVAPYFIAPDLPVGVTEDLEFELLITDNQGFMSKDSVVISVTGVEQLSYCESSGLNTSWEWIDGVSIAGQSTVSGNNNGYADFTQQAPTVLVRGDNAITLMPGFGYGAYTEHWTIWVDTNHDGEFSKQEQLFRDSSRSNVNGTLTIPVDAVSGTTRMRISMRYNGKAEACGTFQYGEVEDYNVIIQ